LSNHRATSPALDARLGCAIPVLDHGFIRVVDYMGDDSAIVQAARVSYGAGTKSVRDDEGLIRYLMRQRHSTPFEMCEIKLHVKLPIYVARQWIRHRTANVNEISGRYSVLDAEAHTPAAEEIAAQSTSNRQGRGAALPPEAAAQAAETLRAGAALAFSDYEALLAAGVAREQARITLPLSAYTQWYWKIDLHNLFHFIALRADSHAQSEIRAYADALSDIVADWVPLAWAAFRDYRLEAATLSGPALRVLRRMLAGEAVDAASSGLSAREWAEMSALFEHR